MESLAASIEAAYLIGPSGIGRLAATGEPFVTIAGDRVKGEGEEVTMYLTEDEAVEQFKRAVELYGRRGNTLYWRRKPEMVSVEGKCYVNARLLISSLTARGD